MAANPTGSVGAGEDGRTTSTAQSIAIKPTDLPVVRFFLLTLGALLAGYTFLGRGFAHVGVGPVYVGDIVLAFGLVVTAYAALRSRLQVSRSWLVGLLVVFMSLGLVRTVPYIPTDGINALRDATLWGYAVFALMLFALLDREWVSRLFKLYGWMAIAFLLWGPVASYIFNNYQPSIPIVPGSSLPILYFKNSDMAVQAAGAIAFLVVGTPLVRRVRDFLWRAGAAVPATWMVYYTGSLTRGGLAAVAASIGVLAVTAGRTRNWLPVVCGAMLFAVMVTANVSVPSIGPAPTQTSTPTAIASGPSPTPSPSPSANPSATPSPAPTESTTGRSVGPGQWIANIASVFFNSANGGLEGTKDYRLRWWSKIIDYTFHGPYFWTGKGFGINLADDDGFQTLADDSLRAPHNSHFSVLARMGVPGLLLWIVLQGAFALLLLLALLAHRRAGDLQLAAVAAWVLAFWAAIMVNTSFDPYLEGPQGGIWFWALVGLGLVVIRLAPRRRTD